MSHKGPRVTPSAGETRYRDANWQYLAARPPMPISLAVAYDGLLSLVGLALSGLIMPAVTILGVVVLGFPVRLIPWVNRRWAGNGRKYVPIAAIAVGLMTSGFLTGVRQVGTEDGIDYDTLTPDPSLLYSGWVLLAFLLANATLIAHR